MEEKKIIIKYQELSYDELEKSDKELIEKAIKAAKDAYVPYSDFHVGVAVKLNNGTILKGNNQENAAYPSGLCAERVVLFYANANYPDNAVDTMAIVTTDNKGEIIGKNASPCGACRQVIAETEVRYKTPVRILMASKKSVLIFNSIADLLPFSFNQESLG